MTWPLGEVRSDRRGAAKRRVYAHAALVAQQSVDIEMPNRALVSNAKFTAYVFGWANDDGPSAPRDGSPDSEGLRESHLACSTPFSATS